MHQSNENSLSGKVGKQKFQKRSAVSVMENVKKVNKWFKTTADQLEKSEQRVLENIGHGHYYAQL